MTWFFTFFYNNNFIYVLSLPFLTFCLPSTPLPSRTPALLPTQDLQTAMETGIWTWNWMDASVGEMCFLFVALAYMRGQMQNLRWRPYTESIREMRARRLVKTFPDYNAQLVHTYSITDKW